MNISGEQHQHFSTSIALNHSPDSDLRPHRRRNFNTPGSRLRRSATSTGRRSRPETPSSKWKIPNEVEENGVGDGGGGDPVEEPCRKREKQNVTFSARKLAAALWRLQLPEVAVAGDCGIHGGLRLQNGIGYADHPYLRNQNGVMHGSDTKYPSKIRCSVSGTKDGHFCELGPFRFSSTAMEGMTKWDPVSLKTSDEGKHIYSQMKLLDQKNSTVSSLEAELEQARVRIQELETERHSSKKKLEHFLKKVREERASWKSKEHEKIRAYVDDIKTDLNRERKSRQKVEMVNSRLVNELADAKLLAKRCMQDYEKERKASELIEEVCDELAKEIGKDKAEVESLKRESMTLREEMEEERRMLQMAEVWREERVHMKLIDAKVALDEKYSQMNELVAYLESFLKSVNVNSNAKEIREAQSLQQAAASVNIQDIKGFSYEPSNPDDIFAIFEDVNSCEATGETESCIAYSPVSHASKIHMVSPEANPITKKVFQRCPDIFLDNNCNLEEDESGWETVSHVEDQRSSCSPEGSAPSVTKNGRESNVSGMSVIEWEVNAGEETPLTEISEVCSVPTKQSKRISSIARLWRSGLTNEDNYKLISMEGMNGRLSNGMVSNGDIMSPEWGHDKSGFSPQDILCQLSSPESGSVHNRGMKACIPRTGPKGSLKSRLMEARMESHKVQLRHVLKQKI